MRQKFMTFGLLILLSSLFIEAAPKKVIANQRPNRERHLIICLDGVGYEVMAEMQREGYFSYLRNISHMIAPFPSITNHSLTAILKPYGAPNTSGYEDFYYDLHKNRKVGGLSGPLKGTFWERFHAHPSLLGMAGEYIWPPLSCWLEGRLTISKLPGKFLKSPQPVYLAYVGGTDSVAHTADKAKLKALLRELDKTLRAIRARDPQAKISLFSDHGNQFMSYKHIELKRHLAAFGFRATGKISGPSSLVHPVYGLIGSAAFYSRTDEKYELARALGQREGVDFACLKDENAVYLVNAQGRAKIVYAAGRFAYQPETADPLALAPIMQAMQAVGLLDENGFAEDRVWFAHTQEHIYPDPLHRLWAAFGDYVANPASVIVNLKDGYYTGSPFLKCFVRLKATHGNLQRGETIGFAASTAHVLPSYLRADDVWQALNANSEFWLLGFFLPLLTLP